MRYLLILILLGVSNICSSQDTLQISAEELEEFFLAMDTLKTQDSLKTILITELEEQIVYHKRLDIQNELIIGYKNEEIKLLNEQIELYNKRLTQVDKWYKKPWVGAVGMIFFLHAVDYTLPQ